MKVLILAYDFPPFVSVGGLRPYSWSRYLAEFGVEPVVITRQWSNHYGDERDYIAPSATARVELEETERATILRTPYSPNLSHRLLLRAGPGRYRLGRKLITAWYEIGQYHATIGPKAELYRTARRYLGDHKVDAIVATGEPFVLFKYAAQLSKEFSVPWVADYRDPWSQDKRRTLARLLPGWESGIEKRLVSSASEITTASEFFRDLLAELHGGRRAVVIPNGYDPDAMAGAQDLEQGKERLTIAFTGTISPWHPVESVFRVFNSFVKSGGALALKMVGINGRESLEELVHTKFPDLALNTTFLARLPNDQMAKELAKANVFLMFNMYAYPGTKIFDYLALKRKIVLCYSDDAEAIELKRRYYKLSLAPGADERVLERMVEETRSGVVVKDASQLGVLLTDLSREFEADRKVACETVGAERYSRRSLAGQLAGVLQGLAQ